MRNQENIAPIDQYVIDFVRELRIKKELTQEDIGNIVELSRSFVSDIESNNSRAKYNIRHINILADHFGISPREFLPKDAMPVDFIKDKKTSKPIKKASSKKPVLKKAVAKKASPKKK
jgi:transcriptional regulator with XRE-family HTH domain